MLVKFDGLKIKEQDFSQYFDRHEVKVLLSLNIGDSCSVTRHGKAHWVKRLK